MADTCWANYQDNAYFGSCLEVEREDVFALARFALPDEEDAVSVDALLQHKMSSLHARQRPVEPWVLVKVVVDVAVAWRCWCWNGRIQAIGCYKLQTDNLLPVELDKPYWSSGLCFCL